MKRIWINRIVSIVSVIICQSLLAKYHISSGWAFIAGMVWIVGMLCIFEFIKEIIGE
jgi:hypothetical protein